MFRLVVFLTCFSAADVPESPVPERQRFWRARVLGQVQRSRGEHSTLFDSSHENFSQFRGGSAVSRRSHHDGATIAPLSPRRRQILLYKTVHLSPWQQQSQVASGGCRTVMVGAMTFLTRWR